MPQELWVPTEGSFKVDKLNALRKFSRPIDDACTILFHIYQLINRAQKHLKNIFVIIPFVSCHTCFHQHLLWVLNLFKAYHREYITFSTLLLLVEKEKKGKKAFSTKYVHEHRLVLLNDQDRYFTINSQY